MAFGRYFEEFVEGEKIQHSLGKTITESDNNLFSLLTMNHHPIHINQHYASQQQHGQILVVGTLVFSLVVGLTVSDISGKAVANLEYESIKHLRPTFIGDSLYAVSTILSKTSSATKPDRGIIQVETVAHNQRNEEVLQFRRKVLVFKRDVK